MCGDVTTEPKPFFSRCARHSSVVLNAVTKLHLMVEAEAAFNVGVARMS